jgi:hypothetical protein
MKRSTQIILAGLAILVAVVLILTFRPQKGSDTVINIPSGSISDGVITIPYSEDTFALAVNKEQIQTNAYIPPCDDIFAYCFYYTGTAYSGTNLESAGLRILKRGDLGREQKCLETPPEGYADFVPAKRMSTDTYATSLFPTIGDAALGHYAQGYLYRLYLRDKLLCYEFETRIGQSRFQNYPEGTIKEFTETDERDIADLLDHLLRGVTLPNKQTINFPVLQ